VKVMGMCINWKVIAGLALTGVALFVFVSPDAALAAVPLLLLAACPLSMIAMVWGMSKMGGMQEGASCATGNQTAQGGSRTRDQQISALREQQELLAQQIAALEEQSEAPTTSVRPAEAVRPS
jgi:hypothetical protein